jgi:predicted nucleotidyltransferase
MIPTLETVVPILRKENPYLHEHFGITELGVFGSVARGEATEESDIDVLVSFQTIPNIFVYVDAVDYLGERFSAKVDVVRREALTGKIASEIMKEVIAI